jgi:hypothetical protein
MKGDGIALPPPASFHSYQLVRKDFLDEILGLGLRWSARLGSGFGIRPRWTRAIVRTPAIARGPTIAWTPAIARGPTIAWTPAVARGPTIAWTPTVAWRTPAIGRRIGFTRRRPIRRPRTRRRIGPRRSRRYYGSRRGIRPNRRSRAPRRRRPVHPVALPSIPGPASVVAAPIVADGETDDTDSQLRAESQDGYPAVLIVVIQQIAINPAAVASQIHIAPSPVIQATVDVQCSIGRYGVHQRIVGARSGTQMHETLGVCDAGPGRGSGTHCHQDK